jgi:hypothetical protein
MWRQASGGQATDQTTAQAGAGAGPLLATKLHMPPVRPGWVIRPHLIERLDAGLRAARKLTLISAPPGFGKTTLLVSWLTERLKAEGKRMKEKASTDPSAASAFSLQPSAFSYDPSAASAFSLQPFPMIPLQLQPSAFSLQPFPTPGSRSMRTTTIRRAFWRMSSRPCRRSSLSLARACWLRCNPHGRQRPPTSSAR